MTNPFSEEYDFSGTTRLFPLPNLVLFPQVMQPLHIFEPRYREMTHDALDGDKLISMALLQPDWEEEYLSNPPIHDIVCVSRIVAEQELEDGRFNILVRGLCRARIEEEIETEKLYRVARITPLAEVPVVNGKPANHLRDKLLEMVPIWFPSQPAVFKQFQELAHQKVSLGTFSDILSFALPLPLELKQGLLRENDVEKRSTTLLAHLLKAKPNSGHSGTSNFPPDFSTN